MAVWLTVLLLVYSFRYLRVLPLVSSMFTGVNSVDALVQPVMVVDESVYSASALYYWVVPRPLSRTRING